jgi:hypothetical protein
MHTTFCMKNKVIDNVEDIIVYGAMLMLLGTQCENNVTLRYVHETSMTVEKQ